MNWVNYNKRQPIDGQKTIILDDKDNMYICEYIKSSDDDKKPDPYFKLLTPYGEEDLNWGHYQFQNNVIFWSILPDKPDLE